MISPEALTRRSIVPARAAVRRFGSLPGAAQDARLQRQIRRVADAITREFPTSLGGTLLFCGVGSSSHVADVSQHVARQLAVQCRTEVVLVDGDAETQLLTDRLAATGRAGLAEVIQQQTPVAAALDATALEQVRFLPLGDRCLTRNPIASESVKTLLADLRQVGRYTVIAAGTKVSPLLAMLSRHSDGTYLVVQLGVADQQDTSQLANYLTRAGGRLLGCVATSVV